MDYSYENFITQNKRLKNENNIMNTLIEHNTNVITNLNEKLLKSNNIIEDLQKEIQSLNTEIRKYKNIEINKINNEINKNNNDYNIDTNDLLIEKNNSIKTLSNEILELKEKIKDISEKFNKLYKQKNLLQMMIDTKRLLDKDYNSILEPQEIYNLIHKSKLPQFNSYEWKEKINKLYYKNKRKYTY